MRYEITLYDKGFVYTHIFTFPKMVGSVCDTNWMEFWVQPRQTHSEMETNTDCATGLLIQHHYVTSFPHWEDYCPDSIDPNASIIYSLLWASILVPYIFCRCSSSVNCVISPTHKFQSKTSCRWDVTLKSILLAYQLAIHLDSEPGWKINVVWGFFCRYVLLKYKSV